MPEVADYSRFDEWATSAMMRAHAKTAIHALHADGFVGFSPIVPSDIHQGPSPAPGLYEFVVSHKHADNLPETLAGIVVEQSLSHWQLVRITHSLPISDTTHIKLAVQLTRHPTLAQRQFSMLGMELWDAHMQSLKSMAVVHAKETNEKTLFIQSLLHGTPLYEPTAYRIQYPRIFDENILPAWGFSQAALAVFDDEKISAILHRWETSLERDRFLNTHPEHTLMQLSADVVSA